MGQPVTDQKVTVKLDVEALAHGIDRAINRLPFAAQRALSRTATTTRAFMARQVAADLALPVTYIKERIKVAEGIGVVELSASFKRIPLFVFNARGPNPSRNKPGGVTYKLPTGKGRLEHGFIATMPNGYVGVFVLSRYTKNGLRYGRPGPRGGRRETIEEKAGPSLGHAFMKHVDEGEKTASAALAKNVMHELAFATAGSGFPILEA
jgi:hypothetical protein